MSSHEVSDLVQSRTPQIQNQDLEALEHVCSQLKMMAEPFLTFGVSTLADACVQTDWSQGMEFLLTQFPAKLFPDAWARTETLTAKGPNRTPILLRAIKQNAPLCIQALLPHMPQSVLMDTPLLLTDKPALLAQVLSHLPEELSDKSKEQAARLWLLMGRASLEHFNNYDLWDILIKHFNPLDPFEDMKIRSNGMLFGDTPDVVIGMLFIMDEENVPHWDALFCKVKPEHVHGREELYENVLKFFTHPQISPLAPHTASKQTKNVLLGQIGGGVKNHASKM